jgi:hypothetical protein
VRLLLAVALLAGAGCVCGPSSSSDAGAGGGGAGGGVGGGSGLGGGDEDFDAGCTGPVPCYDGPNGTAGTGACRLGLSQCHEGELGPCIGQVVPTPETCDGVDNDCNGAVDDGLGKITCGLGPCATTVDACTSGKPTLCTAASDGSDVCDDGVDGDCDGLTDDGCNCIYVSASVPDTNTGTGMTPSDPVKTITQGIAAAVANNRKWLCVGAGSCDSLAPMYTEAVEMADGVSLMGGFDETASWQHMSGCTSTVQAVDARGMHFGPSVQSATGFETMTVLGAADGGAAVTIEGARGVVITESYVFGQGGDTSVGVLMAAGAEATITRSNVAGGDGKIAIGLESVNATPHIVNNCSSSGLGDKCLGTCADGYGIRGRRSTNPGAQSIGLLLEDSPGAIVDESMICAGPAAKEAIGVSIHGDATGTVLRRSTVNASDQSAVGVGIDIERCAGTSPWIFDNALVWAGGASSIAAFGIRVAGDCPARIDSNEAIVVGSEADGGIVGVQCTQDDTGAPSRCVIVGTGLITNSNVARAGASIGVECDVGACALVQRNHIDPRTGSYTAGLIVTRSGPLIARNEISGGCPTVGGAGLVSQDSFARVENNRIQGATCLNPPGSDGVLVLLAAGHNEVDLNSNTIGAGLDSTSCTSVGLTFGLWDDAGVPGGPRGLVRNNIIAAGQCTTGVSIIEQTPDVDPYVLENNDLVPGDAGVYLDEGKMLYQSIYPVNVLTGAAANISVDPMFVDGGFHLGEESACRNAGTPAGAPADDYDGDPRPLEGRNDIGADEYRP